MINGKRDPQKDRETIAQALHSLEHKPIKELAGDIRAALYIGQFWIGAKTVEQPLNVRVAKVAGNDMVRMTAETLKSIEWVCWSPGVYRCPCCGAKMEDKHLSKCRLRATLDLAEGKPEEAGQDG